jgi:hypothetical protein
VQLVLVVHPALVAKLALDVVLGSLVPLVKLTRSWSGRFLWRR